MVETERAPAATTSPPAPAPRAERPGRGPYRWAFLGLLVLALALRVAFVLATPNYVPIHDDHDYDRVARSVADGNGYPSNSLTVEPRKEVVISPSAYRPPAWPYVLGGIYAVFGHDITAARILLAVLGTGLVALVGLLTLQLWRRSASLWATGLAAIYVPLGLVGSSLLSETLLVVLELGALAAVLAQRRRGGGWGWTVLAGVLVGCAALTRFNGILLLVPVGLLAWTGRPRWAPRSLARPLGVALLAVAVIAPWTIRNAVELHAFVPVSTEAGETLAGTYNRVARRDRRDPGAWKLIKFTEYAKLKHMVRSGLEADRTLRRQAFRFIARHPGYVAEVAWFNTRQLLQVAGTHRWDLGVRTLDVAVGWGLVSAVAFWIVLVLALAGAVTGAARRAPPALWLAPALMLLSAILVIGEAPRFRAPADPFLLALGGLALSVGFERLRARRQRPRKPAGAAAA